jgi:hypothetical protein
MGAQVLLAPVPCDHLDSAMKVPGLSRRVAFGTSKSGLSNVPIGLPVFIYASQPPHPLFLPGVFSWAGKLGAIVKAVERGPRSGKHPDLSIRPPTAEACDTASMEFWEVLDLAKLEKPRSFREFLTLGGGEPFNGREPQWPIVAQLRA